MDRIELLAALKRAFEDGYAEDGDSTIREAARSAARQRINELLSQIDDLAERIAIMESLKTEVNAQHDDEKRRLDMLKLALVGQIEIGAKDDHSKRFQVMEQLNTLYHVGPADLRRAFAKAGQDAVRRCGRPDVGLDRFTSAVRAADLLAESAYKERLELDEETMHAAHGVLHRMARWALFGFNVFSPSAALAAKLVLTDVPDDAAPPLPYDTFVIALPDGAIPFFAGDPDATRKEWADSIWVHRAVVAPGEEPVVVVSVAWRRFVVSRQAPAPTSALGPSPRPGEHLAPEDEVAIEGAWRLARNFLLWLDASGGLKKHRPATVPRKLQEKRARSSATWPTEWEFGREVTITSELRDAAREAVAGRTRRHVADGWHVRSRFIVRGHWWPKDPSKIPLRGRRRWVEPFWKGRDGAKAWSHIYEGK